ncbi:MAG: hypothetical protein IJZ64_00730 [Ruminococcus sp.]|nr:hypothetical protein [Ruminococcus sp.]
MPNSPQDWFAEIQPRNQEIDSKAIQRIKKNVQKSLNEDSKQEESDMNKKTIKYKVKPLILIAAILGIGTTSLVTANAATDGDVIAKIKFFVNGEEQEFEGKLIQELDDGTVVYGWTPENQDENSENILSYSVEISEDAIEEDSEISFEITEDESKVESDIAIVEIEGETAESVEIIAEEKAETEYKENANLLEEAETEYKEYKKSITK